MIAVEHLTYTYPPVLAGIAEWETVLDAISLTVDEGACLAVTGPNACGKSTLCLAVAGLAPRLTEGRLTGAITVAGRDPQSERPGALADTIGILLQDPTGQLFNPGVGQEIAWGLENLGLPPGEIDARIHWALGRVGLGDISWEQSPAELSGGQQKRLALAAVLALQPQVLILDEPAGGLSPRARRDLIAILRDLRRDSGLTILLAETDPDMISALADALLVLDASCIQQVAPPRDIYLQSSAHHLILPPSAVFARQVNMGSTLNLSCLTPQEAADQLAPHLQSGSELPPPPQSDPVLADEIAVELDEVSFSYYPGRPILHDISLRVHCGELVALIGDNGAGKTTLARHLVGLLRPASGRIAVMGRDSAGLNTGQMARYVGLAFQNPEQEIFNPTVREEIAFGPRNLGMSRADCDRVVDETLRQFELQPLRDHPPAALTFGTRRMVALAGIAAMQTPVLVLDEPLVGLDAQHQALVLDWLLARKRAGAGVLLITHDMEAAARLADRVLVMQSGWIAAEGTPSRVFVRRDLLDRTGLEPPFALHLAQALDAPGLAADLTPQGAARVLIERLS